MSKVVLNIVKIYRSRTHGLTVVGQTETAKIWYHQDGKFVIRGELSARDERAILAEMSYQLGILIDEDAQADEASGL